MTINEAIKRAEEVTGRMTIDEAIKHAEEVASKMLNERVQCIKCAEEHQQLAEWLKELKQLKEKEPKIGHWEYVQYDKPSIGNWRCSECGRIISLLDYQNPNEIPLCNHCPWCGAKMREEE